jgi:type I restriction enzyme, S subunit
VSIQEFTAFPVTVLARVLTTLENGSRPAGGVSNITKGIPSLGGEHLNDDGSIDFEDMKFVPEEHFSRMTRGIIRKHDVLVVKDGATTGKTAFVGDDFPFENATINEHIFILRPDADLVIPEFLFYFIYSTWGQAQMQREFHGGAIGGINQSFADYLEIPVPPIFEQREIIRILGLATTLKGLQNTALRKTRTLHSALFKTYFGTGQPNQENLETVKLKSLLRIPLSNGYSPNTNDDPSGIPVFNLSALTDFGLDETRLKYYPGINWERKGGDLELDDLLISRSNTIEFVGRVGRYRGEPSHVIYPDTMIRIRLDNHVKAVFIEHYLRGSYMRAIIKQLARGTSGSMKKISQGDINDFDISMPGTDELEDFAQKVAILEDQEQNQRDALGKFNELIKYLLPLAYSGELTRLWREEHAEELQRAAVERDKRLGLRGEKPRWIDYKMGRVTPEEAERFRQAIQPLTNSAIQAVANAYQPMLREFSQNLLKQANFTNFASEVLKGLPDLTSTFREAVASSVGDLDQVMRRSLSDVSSLLTSVVLPLNEAIRQSTENFYLSLANQLSQIALTPPPQPNRAIHESLDESTSDVLRMAQFASTYYFRPEDFADDEIDPVQIESSLHMLEALGFVRKVELDGRLVYRLVDETVEIISKPDGFGL